MLSPVDEGGREGIRADRDGSRSDGTAPEQIMDRGERPVRDVEAGAAIGQRGVVDPDAVLEVSEAEVQ
jgi:hypothetical protein